MIKAILLVALVATVAAQPVTPAAKPANATAAAATAPAATAKPAVAPAAAAKPAAAATATTPAATAKSAAVPAAAAGAAAAGAAVATKDAAAPGAAEPALPASKCGAAVTETSFALKSVSGSGCENNDALLGKPYVCASTMLANITDISGPAGECTFPGEISMSSGEATCVDPATNEGYGVLGNGKIQPAAEGVRSLNGTWNFAKPGPFDGKVNADGSLTIMTALKDGTVCELTYGAGTAKKPIKLPADEAEYYVAQAKLDAEQAKEDQAAIANGTMPAPEAPKKSSAAAAGVSGFMLLLGAAAALF